MNINISKWKLRPNLFYIAVFLVGFTFVIDFGILLNQNTLYSKTEIPSQYKPFLTNEIFTDSQEYYRKIIFVEMAEKIIFLVYQLTFLFLVKKIANRIKKISNYFFSRFKCMKKFDLGYIIVLIVSFCLSTFLIEWIFFLIRVKGITRTYNPINPGSIIHTLYEKYNTFINVLLIVSVVSFALYMGSVLVVFACFALLVVVILTHFTITILSNQKTYYPADFTEKGNLKSLVKDLVDRVGFPLYRLHTPDSITHYGSIQGYTMSLFQYGYIVIAKGSLRELTTEEVLGLLAHELGHWKLFSQIKVLSFVAATELAILLGLYYFAKSKFNNFFNIFIVGKKFVLTLGLKKVLILKESWFFSAFVFLWEFFTKWAIKESGS